MSDLLQMQYTWVTCQTCFYVYCMAIRLVVANKQDPETLEEGETMQAMLDGVKGTMIDSVDVENGYNEIMCSAILEQ
eukprot:12445080-Ditylum_brightwellii.AAC.1